MKGNELQLGHIGWKKRLQGTLVLGKPNHQQNYSTDSICLVHYVQMTLQFY